jgi:hypothetical protein
MGVRRNHHQDRGARECVTHVTNVTDFFYLFLSQGASNEMENKYRDSVTFVTSVTSDTTA